MKKLLATVAIIAVLAAGSAYYVLSLPEVPQTRADISSSYRLTYMLSAYGIEELGQVPNEPPPSSVIDGVPAISRDKQYCATTCLQMITRYYGMNYSIDYLNFITGFTYGATFYSYGGNVFFLPYSDPFAGLRNASDYLGLRYRFLVTDDGEEFIKAVKLFIASGTPVIIPVNTARLYSLGGFTPHFELVVGYEGDELIIHEPVKPYPGAPSVVRFKAGLVSKANEDLMRAFGLMWAHGFGVYELGGEKVKDFSDALRNVGALEKGFLFEGVNVTIATGSYAIEELADAVEKGLVDPEYLKLLMRMAQETREDDARFIGGIPCCVQAAKAAELLYNASRIYGEVLRIVSERSEGWSEEAASLLKSAAQAERLVGVLLIDASYSCYEQLSGTS